MNITSAQLLKLLASGVHPAGASASCASGAVSAPGEFADLLQRARNGGLASELPVTLGTDAQGISLDQDQFARLSIAADQLEASGVRSALVSIDGQKLLLDVHARQVVGRATAENGITGGIDGVLDLGDARARATSDTAQQSPFGAPAKSGALGLPSPALGGNPDILKLLAGLSQQPAS